MSREVENKSVWFGKSHPPEQGHPNGACLVSTMVSWKGEGVDKNAEMGGSNVRRVNEIKTLRASFAAHQ